MVCESKSKPRKPHLGKLWVHHKKDCSQAATTKDQQQVCQEWWWEPGCCAALIWVEDKPQWAELQETTRSHIQPQKAKGTNKSEQLANSKHQYLCMHAVVSQPDQWFSGRVSTQGLVLCGFDTQPGHIRDCENGPHCLLIWHSLFGVELVGVGSLNLSWQQDCRCPLLPQGSNAEDCTENFKSFGM